MTVTDIAVTLEGTEFRGEALDLPAAGKGHDAWAARDGFIAVADGSTPLIQNQAIDAQGYARDALARLSAHPTTEPAEMFRRALSAASRPSAPTSQLASCTVATAAARGNSLDISALGDCIASVRTTSGGLFVAWDRRLDQFDGPVAGQIAQDLIAGRSLEGARAAATPQLIENRDRANTDSTYWIFADDPAAAEHIETTSVDLRDVDAIFLCSDGFSRLIDPFHAAEDVRSLIGLAEADGLGGLGRELRAMEEAPNSLVDYPRLDRSDDATALLLVKNQG